MDWTQDIDPNASNNSNESSISIASKPGYLGASRTSNAPLSGAEHTIGIFGLGVNDCPTEDMGAYGGYFEGWALPGMNPEGTVQAVEIAIINKSTAAPDVNPYNQNPPGVIDSRISIGKPDSYSLGQFGPSQLISALLQFVNAECTANSEAHKGIVFGANAIIGGIAIALAQGHKLQWYSPDGKSTGFIRCDVGTGQSTLNLIFANNGLYLQDNQGHNTHLFCTDGNGNGHIKVMQNNVWKTVI